MHPPTCKSRIKTELKQIKEEMQANEDERRGMNNFGREKKYEGYAARAQTQLKHRVYGPLITIARKQLYDGRRSREPKFFAAVATTLGEIGLETIKVQEFITWVYARNKSLEGERDDGKKLVTLTAEFRNDLRTKIVIGVAKGMARMLNTAGLPSGSCKNSYSRGR